jgi:copper transport protein
VSTDPADGSVVHQPVRVVSATFDETVGVSDDSLRVFAPDGQRVDTGGTTVGASPTTIQVALESGLADGTYTVAWHVVSADTHPIQGAFTFSIGHRSSHVSGSSVIGGGSRTLSALYAVDRAAGYIGFVIAAGGVLFLAVCWPVGLRDRRTVRLVGSAWVVTVVAALLQLPLQGALASGRGVGAVLDPHVVRQSFDDRVGIAIAIRVLALGLLAVLFVVLSDVSTEDDRARQQIGILLLVTTGCAALTWSVAGHEGTGTWWPLALGSDMVHLVSATFWLGGLALLVFAVLRRDSEDTPAAQTAVLRFSPLATWCVLLIVLTGTYQAWRNTRSWAALFETRYGLLVCAKVALLCGLVLLGLQARKVLGARPFRAQSREGIDLRRLRRGVVVEAALAAVVLGVTAVLVQSPTALESYHPVPSASQSFDTGTVRGTVTAALTPARLGPNHVQLRLTDASGTAYRPKQVTAALSQEADDVGPLPVELHTTGPGTYESSPVSLGFSGTWTLSVVVRSDAFDEATVALELPVT